MMDPEKLKEIQASWPFIPQVGDLVEYCASGSVHTKYFIILEEVDTSVENYYSLWTSGYSLGENTRMKLLWEIVGSKQADTHPGNLAKNRWKLISRLDTP